MKVSVCMATYGRPEVLDKVLRSIFSQKTAFDFEVVVVDDAGPSSAQCLCRKYPIRYARIDREPGYRNPAVARNLSYRMARGDVLVCQSDDVVHQGETLRPLVDELHEGEFLVATVWNVDADGKVVGMRDWPKITQLTGPLNRRPLLFLGSVWREDMYAVGGNDEEFTEPGREDVWLAQCLINGRHLTPRYTAVTGHHQDHPRPADLTSIYRQSAQLYRRKALGAQSGDTPWRGGEPWPYSTLPPARGTASLPAASCAGR
jgi:glycosyltransferase involved in cell wall biosynthesis